MLFSKVCNPPEIVASTVSSKVPGGFLVTLQLDFPHESFHPPPFDLQLAVLLLQLDHSVHEIFELTLKLNLIHTVKSGFKHLQLNHKQTMLKDTVPGK